MAFIFNGVEIPSDVRSRAMMHKEPLIFIRDWVKWFETQSQDINCTCGKLLAKKKASKIEIKCVKCKQIVEV